MLGPESIEAKKKTLTANGFAESEKSRLTREQAQLLLEHLPLVGVLARRIHSRIPQHVPVDDLASAGTVGLIDAALKFEPEKKVSFSQYAQFRIRGAILDSLRSLDWGPKKLRQQSRQLQDAQQRLTARLHRTPEETEIAGEMGLTLEAYQQLVTELHGLHIGSLHEPRSGDGSEEEEIDFIPARSDENPFHQCVKGEMISRLSKAIQALPDRERTVMTLYYYEEMSMRDISLALKVSEGRISQVHTRAVNRLKEAMRESAGFKPVRSARMVRQAAFAA